FLVWHLSRAQPVIDIASGDWGGFWEFSLDSRRLAVCRRDGSIAILDVDSGRQVMKLGQGPMPLCLAWHPDGAKLAPGTGPIQGMRVYDLDTRQRLFDLQHPQLPPGSFLTWSPDGTKLAQSCRDGRVFIWDAIDRGPPRILSGHSGKATYVAFNHRGDLL